MLNLGEDAWYACLCPSKSTCRRRKIRAISLSLKNKFRRGVIVIWWTAKQFSYKKVCAFERLQRFKKHTHLKTQVQCILSCVSKRQEQNCQLEETAALWRPAFQSRSPFRRSLPLRKWDRDPHGNLSVWEVLCASNSDICIVIIFLKGIKISQVSKDCGLEDGSCQWLAEQGVRWSIRGHWAPSREVTDGRALLQCFLTGPGH